MDGMAYCDALDDRLKTIPPLLSEKHHTGVMPCVEASTTSLVLQYFVIWLAETCAIALLPGAQFSTQNVLETIRWSGCELTALCRPASWIYGADRPRQGRVTNWREGEGTGGEGRGRKGRRGRFHTGTAFSNFQAWMFCLSPVNLNTLLHRWMEYWRWLQTDWAVWWHTFRSTFLAYFIWLQLLTCTVDANGIISWGSGLALGITGFPRTRESHWKYLNSLLLNSRPWKYLKTGQVLQSPWISFHRSLKVLEFTKSYCAISATSLNRYFA